MILSGPLQDWFDFTNFYFSFIFGTLCDVDSLYCDGFTWKRLENAVAFQGRLQWPLVGSIFSGNVFSLGNKQGNVNFSIVKKLQHP